MSGLESFCLEGVVLGLRVMSLVLSWCWSSRRLGNMIVLLARLEQLASISSAHNLSAGGRCDVGDKGVGDVLSGISDKVESRRP